MEASAVKLRRSAAIRVGLSVVAAAGLTALAIVLAWRPLDVETSVVGYPLFADFNVFNYRDAYFLVIGFFPLTALLLFLLLTRMAPRFGLAVPESRESMLPVAEMREDATPLAGEPTLLEVSAARRRTVGAARIAFVGAVLGLETSIGADWTWWHGLAVGIAAYALIVVAAATLLRRRLPEWSQDARRAAVNCVGTVLTIAGLVAVSAGSEVSIIADGSVDRYNWMPLWLGPPAAAILAAIVALALRRAGSAAAAVRIERTALLLVAAPIALFVALQSLPGEPGGLDLFHGGEQIGGSRLVLDGFFPWRDVVLTHGIFQDVVYSFGRGIFGDSHWGHGAGTSMIMRPLYLVSVFFLFVYLFGRNWLFLVFAGLLLLEPTVATDQFRLILLPPILLILASELRHATPLKSAALAFLVVVQVILTPEAAPAIPAVAIVLLAYEWSKRRPGTDIRATFTRTLWVGAAGVVFAAGWGAYLAAHGTLDDYLYLSTNLVSGHALSGALPPNPNPGTVSDLYFHFLALLPPATLLISIAYAVVRLRTRQGLHTADWTMAAAALFVLFYYPKFLARMDTGHVYQPFMVALPLALYVVYRVTTAAEGAIRTRWPKGMLLRLTAHPVSLALVVIVSALAWGTLHAQVTGAPAHHRPVVSGAPAPERVGYTNSFDNAAYRDIKQVIDTYLSPHDRLFDFSNTPELFFFLLDRDPSTRYFQVSLAYPVELQADLIDRLQRARPKLIVFDNDSDPFVGLSNFDSMPTMVHLYETGRWILDHYRPLLWTHGLTIYARRDVQPPSQVGLDLADKPVTKGVGFTVQPCSWGYAPNFLSGPGLPPSGAEALDTGARPVPDQATVIGWAGDPRTKLPAREVIGVVGGRIAGRIKPTIRRPDLITYGLPQGFKYAGFQMQVAVERSQTLGLFAVSHAGEVTEIVTEGSKPAKGTVKIDGRVVRLQPNAVYGQINSKTKTRALGIELPPGSRWTDFRWLEVKPGEAGFNDGTLTLYDRPNRPSADREIVFKTLPRSSPRYIVPVGSCSQWHSYKGKLLYLNTDTRQEISAVRLIRRP